MYSIPLPAATLSHLRLFPEREMHSDELNGSAVLAKLDGKDLYLSPGIAYAPFGMLPWERTGVPRLRLDKDGGAWIKTSLPASAASKITRKADLKLSPDGSLSGKLEVSFTGLEAINRRIAQRNNDDIARNKSLEEQIANLIPVGSEVNPTNQPDWMGPEAPLVATFSVKVPGWATLAGSRALVPVGLFGAPEKHVFEYTTRTYPIYFEYPSETAYDINIDLPPNWQVSVLPKPQSHDLHAVGCTLSAESSKSGLHLTRQIDINVLEIDPKYYTALRSFYQGVKAADEQPVVLVPGPPASGS